MKIAESLCSSNSKKRHQKFSQADVTRLIKGAKAAGETVSVMVRPDGTIVATPLRFPEDLAPENEWDNVR